MAGSRAALALLARAGASVPGLRAAGSALTSSSTLYRLPSAAFSHSCCWPVHTAGLFPSSTQLSPSTLAFTPGLRGYSSSPPAPRVPPLEALAAAASGRSTPALHSGHLPGAQNTAPIITCLKGASAKVGSLLSYTSGVVQARGFATRAAAEKATHYMKFKGGKIKFYTSLKKRFKLLKSSGDIKRWKQGYRHKRTPKSKEARARLRRPATVHKAYAAVMKRLGFGGCKGMY
mmetsp:Transcript_33567/g.94972  ORF Transcript_33567/g.94972 Transcript_33567/m.94972 type:complete len:232 (-) Transcript_33567:359-1054(-)